MTTNIKFQVVRLPMQEGRCEFPGCTRDANVTIRVQTEGGMIYGNTGYCDQHADRPDNVHINENW